MTVIDHPQERAWLAGEAETVGMLIDTGGWYATGIKSVEHWVTWKFNPSLRQPRQAR